MTKNKITLIDDDFYARYHPVQNHLDLNASWDGCLFETFGQELMYAWEAGKDEKSCRKIWTLIEGDSGNLWMVPGFHYVNRLGFFITEEEWQEDAEEYLMWDAKDMLFEGNMDEEEVA